MAHIPILIEIEVDEDLWVGPNPSEVEVAWFRDILNGKLGELVLYSTKAGADVGTLKVLNVIHPTYHAE